MIVREGNFHHQPPRQRVARLRDRPAAMTLPAGVLPRAPAPGTASAPGPSETAAHRAARRAAASRSACRCPPEAAQPAHRLPIRLGGGHGGQLRIQLHQPGFEVVDRQQVVVHDHPVGRMRPRQTIDPAPVRLGPRATRIVQPSAKRQFAEPMPAPLPVRARHHEPGRGRAPLRRRPHLGQQPRPMQFRQLARVCMNNPPLRCCSVSQIGTR